MADIITAAAVTPFNFNSRAVRVVIRDGNPWFVATDVAESLAYKSPKDAASYLDDDEKGSAIVRTPGGDQKLTVINESGLYALVLRSRKPEARKFAKWVTAEVLPAIRKTGQYVMAPDTYTTKPKQALPASDAHILRSTIDQFAQRVPNDRRAVFCIQAWSKLKAHFGTSYRDIPADRFGEALQVVYRHIGEFDGLALVDETAHILRTDTINTLCERLTRQLLDPNGYTLEPFIPLWQAINHKIGNRLLPLQQRLALT